MEKTKFPKNVLNPLLLHCKYFTFNSFIIVLVYDGATEAHNVQVLNLKALKLLYHTRCGIISVKFFENAKMELFGTFFGIRGPIDSAPHLTDPGF